MARPTISRSIKRNRLREMNQDCAAAGQDFVPSSSLFAAAGRVRPVAPRRKPTGESKSKPKTTRRAQ